MKVYLSFECRKEFQLIRRMLYAASLCAIQVVHIYMLDVNLSIVDLLRKFNTHHLFIRHTQTLCDVSILPYIAINSVDSPKI